MEKNQKDWVKCRFEDLTISLKRGPFGGDLKKEFFVDTGFPVYEQQHAINNDFSKTRYFISEDRFEKLKTCNVGPGDYIVSCSGTMGKIARLPTDSPRGIINQALLRIRLNEKVINHNYFQHFFKYSGFQKKILKDSRGSGMQNMAGIKVLKSIPVSVSPLPIQRAIVAKIEELFSSLDSAITDLTKAQKQLVIYRQAVLKKAFEGELTKEWREKQTNLPTAEELLEQIKEERQKYFEQQLEDWKKAVKAWEESGKEGKRTTKPQNIKNFKPITEDEKKELPSLPYTWNWCKFGNVCLKIMDGTHFSPKNHPTGDYKYITAKNIKEGRIDLSKISYVSNKDHQEIYARCDVKKGDVLYIKDGATTGRAAINHLNEEFSLLSSVGVFRTSHNFISSKFLEYYLNAQITRNRMLSNMAGVAITRLTLVKLNNSIFIICSKQEQNQIVREIESRLSVCDKVEESIVESLEKAKALRQSILKKAFEGKLLTEEEIAKCKREKDYEPAHKLLERIKEEKKKK